MHSYLRQSTASQTRIIGPFQDDTDFKTDETGLTIANTDCKLSKNGATVVNKNSGGGTHITQGNYAVTFDATDTDTVGELLVSVHVAGALQVVTKFWVLEEAAYDAIFASSAAPATAAGVSAVETDTQDIQSRLPAALVSGRMNSDIGADTGGVVPTAAANADAVWDEVLTAAAHNVANSAGRRLRQLQDFGVYALAAVWVDEVAGTSSGTTSFEDATVTNRADDFDNAQTVAAAVGLNRIFPANGNSITLTATINNFEVGVPGGNWTLALGGQDIGGCDINDADVTGIATGTDPHFHRCLIGASTLPPCELFHCGIGRSGGTMTVGSAGAYRLIDCYSDVAGSGAPVVDLGAAVGATTMEFRRWSGGLTLNNVGTGDVISIDVVSGGTITVNGTGGTVIVRGHCSVVDGSGGAVAITETSVVNMTKINAECDTAISDAALATAAALATVDGIVDAILVDTAEIGVAGAGLTAASSALDLTSLATAAALATVDGNVDTLIARLTAARAGYLDNLSAGAVALASALATVDANVNAILMDTGTDGVVLSTATQQAIATALLDLTAGVETSLTVRQFMRLAAAALFGKLSGAATTTITIRDTQDATNRIVATVDADGNRSAVTLDAT